MKLREHRSFVPVVAILSTQSVRHQEPDFCAWDCRALRCRVWNTFLGRVVVAHNGPDVPPVRANTLQNIPAVVALAADCVEAVVASFGVIARRFL